MNRFLLLPFLLIMNGLQAENILPAVSPLADSLPPAINCPASAAYTLQPFRCDTVRSYTVVAYDNEPNYELTQLSGLPSGSAFPIGATVNSFLVTDAAGNTASCSFTITVADFNVQLQCNDLSIVQLDSNCTAMVDWDLVVENDITGCPQSYLVEIDRTAPLGNGPWLPANILPADINKTLGARVRSIYNSSNVCLGNIMIKDKLGPKMICEDIFIPCEVTPVTPEYLRDSLGLATAYPQISDNCGTVVDTSFLSFLNFVDEFDPATGVLKYTRRVWTATDESGNKSSCEQFVYQIKSTVQDVLFPTDKVYECADTLVYTPAVAGVPYIEFAGREFPLNACAMVFTNVDSASISCGGTSTIYRNWYVLDSETSEETSGLQVIDIQDHTPPSIACPEQITATVDEQNCLALAPMPDVEISDACSGIQSFQARWMQGNMLRTQNGTLAPYPGNEEAPNQKIGVMNDIADFPIGTTVITYFATDRCGNSGSCQWNLTLLDMTPPEAVCDSLQEVFLGPDGQAIVLHSVLDAGSEDACQPLAFKIKLLAPGACADNADFTDQLQLCCADLGDTLTAVLRVYDVTVPQGVVPGTFGEGHFSECSGRLVVRDTLAPLCDNLPDLTVSCSDYDPTFESFGQFTYSCAVDSFFTFIDYSVFDTLCKVGTLIRTFNIVYNGGQTAFCLQHITFDPAPQYYFVRFPNDLVITDCALQADFGQPEIWTDPESCQSISISYIDEIQPIVPDACYEIQRTWLIQNLCHYDENLPLTMIPNPSAVMSGPVVSAPGTTGIWTPTVPYENLWSANTNGYNYIQKIKIQDHTPPSFDDCPTDTLVVQDASNNNIQLWNESYWSDPLLGTPDMCEGSVDLHVNATDACENSELNIRYFLYLDLDGDDIQETVVRSDNLPGFNTVNFNNYNTPNFNGGTPRQFDERTVPPNQKWGFALEKIQTDTGLTAFVRFNTLGSPGTYVAPQLPYGTHRVRWIASDQCNNEKTCDWYFTIRDGKAPDIICPDSVTVYFEETPGIATLLREEVLWSISDNCSPGNMIQTALRISGEGSGFPAESAQSLDFHCIPDANTDQKVEAWVKDVSGNTTFCEVNIHIDSCNIDLPLVANHIIGKITTENELAIKDVSVLAHLSKGNTAISIGDSTNVDGDYDIVLDSASIGNTFLEGTATVRPYKNSDPLNGVTTFDLLIISRHILGLDTLDSPYKLIAADANKSGLITSFDVVEFRKLILGIYTNLPMDNNWRFVPRSYTFPDPENPFQPPFPEFDSTDYFLNGGVFDFIGIKIGDVNMSVDPQNLDTDIPERCNRTLAVQTKQKEVEEGEEFWAPFSTDQSSAGLQFTLSYQNLELLEIKPEKGIQSDQYANFPEKNALTLACEGTEPISFSVRFRALQSGSLCDMLDLNSRITPAAAWLPDERGQVAPASVALAFAEQNGFALLQNSPNPFSDKTYIRFQVPHATDAILKVFDATGQLLFSQSGFYEKGVHAVPVHIGEAPSGILFYSLETPEYRGVGKMVRE